MPELVAANLPAALEAHARFQRTLASGLLDMTPVIAACARDMKTSLDDALASEGNGAWAPRSPNTLLRGRPALGGPGGSIATATAVVGLATRQQPREYEIRVWSSTLGMWMQEGTRPHPIVATNPSGRLAFQVADAVPRSPASARRTGQALFLRGRVRTLRSRWGMRAPSAARTRALGTARTLSRRAATLTARTYRGTLVRPQSVNHPGTPPRPFAVYDPAFFDAHLWGPWLRYLEVARTGALGGSAAVL